jgi:5-methylcytosine-specific restriction endonuclease McrA
MRRRSVSARTRDAPSCSAALRRAGNRCEYCCSPADYASDVFAVEHILPRSKGGLTHISNLALSCQGCNNFKYTATEASDPGSGDLNRPHVVNLRRLLHAAGKHPPAEPVPEE